MGVREMSDNDNQNMAGGVGKLFGYIAVIPLLGLAALILIFLVGAIWLFGKGQISCRGNCIKTPKKHKPSDFGPGSLYRAYWIRQL
jgi:hypothetical protein